MHNKRRLARRDRASPCMPTNGAATSGTFHWEKARAPARGRRSVERDDTAGRDQTLCDASNLGSGRVPSNAQPRKSASRTAEHELTHQRNQGVNNVEA